MSFLKKKGKWGILVYGYGMVVTDRNGVACTENSLDKFAQKTLYRFTAVGGWHKGKEDRWLGEYMNFSIPSDHPLAPIVKNLSENDYVWCWGKLKKSSYLHPNTGKTHNYYCVSLEDIQLRYHANGDLSNNACQPTDVDMETSDDDTFDDIDF